MSLFIYDGHILCDNGNPNDEWCKANAIENFEENERKRIEKYIPNSTVTAGKISEVENRVLKLETQIAKMTLHINNLERCLNVKYEPEPEKPFALPQGYADDWSEHDNNDRSKNNSPR